MARSGSGTGRNLWSHRRFDKRARKFIGRNGEGGRGGGAGDGEHGQGAGTLPLADPGDDVLSY